MFKIAFYLFDYTDDSFKKVYFHHWNDSKKQEESSGVF